jgi:hypothetical protein
LKPMDFFGLKFAFSVNNPHVDLEPIFVCQQLFDSVVQFQKRLMRIKRSFAVLISSSRK